jgi:hypothetical protein
VEWLIVKAALLTDVCEAITRQYAVIESQEAEIAALKAKRHG